MRAALLRLRALPTIAVLGALGAGSVPAGAQPTAPQRERPALVVLAGEEARFTGRITDDSVGRLERLLGSPGGARVTRLRIESGGGQGPAGMRLGRILHARGMDLIVSRACGSSCALYALPAARRVVLEEGALILLHQFASPLLRQVGSEELRRHGRVDPGEQSRWERWDAEMQRVIEAQNLFYADIGIDPARMNLIMEVWVELQGRARAAGKLGSGNIAFAPDRAFLRDCLGFANGAWRDFTVADSNVSARVAATPVAFLIEGRLYFEGDELPGLAFTCVGRRPGAD